MEWVKTNCFDCRRVRLALQRPAWSRDNHRKFPPAFKAAARAFLLAAAASTKDRQQQLQEPQDQPVESMHQGGCCLGDLPPLVLERVLGLAAYPLSAWLSVISSPS